MIHPVDIRICDSASPHGATKMETMFKRTMSYVNSMTFHWSGTQQQFNEWAIGVVEGALKNFANQLTIM